MACILVTGGAGFMGSHLVEALLDREHAVRVLDDLSSGNRENLPRQVEFIHGDVTDPVAVQRAFDGIDACFHLAAIASVVRSSCEWLRSHQVNLTGTINIFNQARRLRAHREIPVVMPRQQLCMATAVSFRSGSSDRLCLLVPMASTNALASFTPGLPARCTGSRLSDCVSSTFTVRGRIRSRLIPELFQFSPISWLVESPSRSLAMGSTFVISLISAMPSPHSVELCRRRARVPPYLMFVPARERRCRSWPRRWLVYIGPSSSPIIGRLAPATCGSRSGIRAMLPNTLASGPKLRWPTV